MPPTERSATPPPGVGSVTDWIDDIKAGDTLAFYKLHQRYFARLARLARRKAERARTASADADEEDVANSALNSFFEGVGLGRFPKLDDRDNLWQLLVVITERKATKQVLRQSRQKRGGGRVQNEVDLVHDAGAEAAGPLVQAVGREPSPEFTAMMAEQCARLLGLLRDDTLRSVASLKMEGFTNDEIAEQLGCVRQTVARKLDLIRRTWGAEVN